MHVSASSALRHLHPFVVAFLGALVLLVGCGASSGASVSHAMAACSPADAPFAKVMNARFAPDYESCTVRTTAAFLNPNSMLEQNLGDEKSVVFEVYDPQAGEGDVEFVKAPKAASDAIFMMKKGDPVLLTGSPAPWATGGAKTHYFSASTVAKGAP